MPARRVLIVGGVAGGASCAARLRRMDEQAEIVIFERSAHVSFANCGLPYYVGGIIEERGKLLVATPETFRGLFRVDVRPRHEVRRIDRQRKVIEVVNLETGDASIESYDALLLSPGASPVRPPLPGIDLPGIHTLRNLEDVDRIQELVGRQAGGHAVVVGGGFIGLEMVENLVHRGMSVTLLELLDQVMPPMDPEMVTPAQDALRRHGVDLHLGCEVASFEAGPDDTLVVAAKDGRSFPADAVILSVGVRPETGLAREAGLEIGSTGGIQVDDHLRTSDPDIFAVGDAVEVRDFVTGLPTLIPLAGPANRQGRIAADVICGREARYRGSQGSAVVGLFDLTLASTGASEKSLRKAGIPYLKIYTHSPHHAGYYPGASLISLKLLFAPRSGKVLGAQAIGKEGVEKRIDVIAMSIQGGLTVFDLEEAELCYAPQYGSAKDPVNIAGFAAANFLRGDVDVVSWQDWKERRESGEVMPLVLDVRPPAARAGTSVPEAVNIPLGQLRSRLDELPRDKEIWVHCGVGKTSYFANRILSQNGFQVKNIAGGITSFKMQPGPVSG